MIGVDRREGLKLKRMRTALHALECLKKGHMAKLQRINGEIAKLKKDIENQRGRIYDEV